MPRPNTRQSSTSKTPPRKPVTNPNLVDLSGRGEVKVRFRSSLSTTGRGRGTTPIGKGSSRDIDSVSTRSSTSIRALRSSPVSCSLQPSQFARTEEFVDSFGRELPSKSLSVVDTESLGSSISDSVVTGKSNLDIPEEMATGGSDKRGERQASGSNTMEGLLEYFQEAMKNTQDEFRRELAALRETMGNTANTRSDSAIPGPNAQPSGLRESSPSYATFNLNIKLKDWKISYSGEGCVSDFLFKLDTLVARSQCPHDHLMSNFHIFLTGKAETFYWDYIRQYQGATYPMLRTALSKEFSSMEGDHEILLKLSTRKQLSKESYDDYHSFVVRWNLRLTSPLPDAALMEIIKKNVHADLKMMLFVANPNDLGNLRDLARKAERILIENKNAGASRQRQVNEISVEDTIAETDMDLDPQVEALKINKTWVAGDYSKIKCWNCLELGHSYIYCPDEKRNVFCYKCGQKGVTTVKCDNPHKGNIRRSEWATGDARSQK